MAPRTVTMMPVMRQNQLAQKCHCAHRDGTLHQKTGRLSPDDTAQRVQVSLLQENIDPSIH